MRADLLALRATVLLGAFSRIFLYLGFVVVCVTSLDWAVIALDRSKIESVTELSAPFGLMFLGRPLLYGIFAITLALPVLSEGGGQSDTVNMGGQTPR